MWEWLKRLFGRGKSSELSHERTQSKVTTKEVVDEDKQKGNQEVFEQPQKLSVEKSPKLEPKQDLPKEEKRVISQRNVKTASKKPNMVKTEMNVTTTIETTTTEVVYVKKKHYEQASKSDLLEKLYLKFPDETKVFIRGTIDTTFEIIAETLLKGEEVSIFNFGKLEKHHKPAREGVNPLTGEEIRIAASNTVKFKSSKHLKELMTPQKWSGVYQLEKTIEKTTIDEYDFEKEVASKSEATAFLDEIEEKYIEDLELKDVDVKK